MIPLSLAVWLLSLFHKKNMLIESYHLSQENLMVENAVDYILLSYG